MTQWINSFESISFQQRREKVGLLFPVQQHVPTVCHFCNLLNFFFVEKIFIFFRAYFIVKIGSVSS